MFGSWVEDQLDQASKKVKKPEVAASRRQQVLQSILRAEEPRPEEVEVKSGEVAVRRGQFADPAAMFGRSGGTRTV